MYCRPWNLCMEGCGHATESVFKINYMGILRSSLDSRGCHSDPILPGLPFANWAPWFFDRELLKAHGKCAVINHTRQFWIICTWFKTDMYSWLLHTFHMLSVIHNQRIKVPSRKWNVLEWHSLEILVEKCTDNYLFKLWCIPCSCS